MLISRMFLNYDREMEQIHANVLGAMSFMVSSKIQECFGRHHDRHNGSRCQREAALDPQDLLGVAGVALEAQRTQFVPSGIIRPRTSEA